MNGLDLFSGIGGISLALDQWVRPVAYCEIDTYCQGVLLSRMAANDLHVAPVWNNVTTLQGSQFNGIVDIVYGGFPCQDISVAGAGKGLGGERSGLFFEIVRLCREIEPRWVFLENVPAITTRGGTEVVRAIAEMGYDCRWCVISAASVGALHRRERWFLLARHRREQETKIYSDTHGSQSSSEQKGEKCTLIGAETSGLCKDVADPESTRSQDPWDGFRNEAQQPLPTCCRNACNTYRKPGEQTDKESITEQTEKTTRRGSTRQHLPFESREHWQEIVSSMGKCSDGVSHRVDKLKALGNSVVPQQAKEAFKILMGIK